MPREQPDAIGALVHVLMHVPSDPHGCAQLHVDVAVVPQKKGHVVGHHVFVPGAPAVNRISTVILSGYCAVRLGVAAAAYTGALLWQAHATDTFVHHVP